MRTEAWRHDSFIREQYDGIRTSLELAEKVTGHWLRIKRCVSGSVG
jgi:hypothetical protein